MDGVEEQILKRVLGDSIIGAHNSSHLTDQGNGSSDVKKVPEGHSVGK